jgi:hypothetical protein
LRQWLVEEVFWKKVWGCVAIVVVVVVVVGSLRYLSFSSCMMNCKERLFSNSGIGCSTIVVIVVVRLGP